MDNTTTPLDANIAPTENGAPTMAKQFTPPSSVTNGHTPPIGDAYGDGATPTDLNASIEGKSDGKGGWTPGFRAKTAPERALKWERHFTQPGQDPFETTEWEMRTAGITGEDGKSVFEQTDCEIPKAWSQLATNVVVSKYFRGPIGSPTRETSVKQVIGRVADTIGLWGAQGGYFASDEDAENFRDELAYLLVHQYGAFNSPVWFNLGVKDAKQQCSACQPYDALVSTPAGLIPIGELVERNAVGHQVFDANGVARIVAVKHNGRKEVLRLHLKSGYSLDVTGDHLVWKRTGYSGTTQTQTGKWVEAGTLQVEDMLAWHRTPVVDKSQELPGDVAEAALAGWLQSDGFVGRYDKGTNRSLTIEAMTVNAAEEKWVRAALESVFPGAHSHTRAVETQDEKLDCQRIRIYGDFMESFIEKWDLMTRGNAMTVPPMLYTAPLPVVVAYLRSLFQAEGYVSVRDNAVIALDMVSEGIVRGVQTLLGRLGIYARVRFKADAREDRQGCWSLSIRPRGDRELFAQEIGFIAPDKQEKVLQSLLLEGHEINDVKTMQIERIEVRGEMDVYDIQTTSGEYLCNGIRVHNCFINDVYDDMESIMELAATEARLFKGGSGAGVNLWRVRSSKEQLRGGGIASGPISFMRGWDAFAGAVKSGGTCLAPHQRVYTAQGPVAVSELAERAEFVALSFDPPANRYKAKSARAWLAGRKEVVRVTTDKGAFELSFDHPVKLSSGEFVQAGSLAEGMSLFACTIDTQHGHLRVSLRDGKKGKEFLHRLVAADVMGKDLDGLVVHHRDGDRLNNAPENLQVMTQAQHAALHGRAVVARGEHIFQTQDFSHAGADNGMHRDSDFWQTEAAATYRETQGTILKAWGRATEMQGEAARQKTLNTAFRVLNAGWKIDTFEHYVTGRKITIGRIASIVQLREQIEAEFGSYDEFVREVARANHRVVSIETIGAMDVYDVEVQCPTADDKSPETGHNFLIWDGDEPTGSGVVVANTRRAAKMVILNADHPDIAEFITCKADEEKKAWALIEAGYNGGFNMPGGAYDSVAFQNANHSVRVTDEFMRAAENNTNWQLRAVTTGAVVETKKARQMLQDIAQTTWICGDPGMQFDTIINEWHTCSNTDRIYASNPCSEFMFLDSTACVTKESRISTPEGLRKIADLYDMQLRGEPVVITTEIAGEHDLRRLSAHRHAFITQTGEREVFKISLADGRRIRATADHRFLTEKGWKRVDELQIKKDRLQLRQIGNTVAFTSDEAEVKRWQMLGWLTGDGVFSRDNVALVFGPEEEQTAREMEGEFNRLIADARAFVAVEEPVLITADGEAVAPNLPRGGSHISRQANGVMQINSKSQALVQYLEEWYGFKQGTAIFKDVPEGVHHVPDDLKVAYLQGLFSADGCIRHDPRGRNARAEEAMLASSSPALLRSVQLMLGDLGLTSRIGWTHPAGRTNPQGQLHLYNQQGRDFLALIGFPCSPRKTDMAKEITSRFFDANIQRPRPATVTAIEPDGVEMVYDLTEPVTHSFIAEGIVTHNCNLASLNLLKFYNMETGEFDAAGYSRACETFLTAQEIIVSFASYPTQKIGEMSEQYRPLGLGYANLGALLMAKGLAYDSDEGRALAGALTAIMTGAAYRKSAQIARNTGPFEGYVQNKEPMLRVIAKHRDAVNRIDKTLVADNVMQEARNVWDDAYMTGQKYGYRNSQATVLAPTGTISFMMDCDTTGVEPDIALVKYKKLVGGGLLKIVNQTVPAALRNLGYNESEIKTIVDYIDKNDTIEGAPGLLDDHLSVFDCAFKAMNGTRSIHHMGHIKMMAATQPFISGAISKCVTGETLIATAKGIVPIASFYRGEKPGEFTPLQETLASIGAPQEADLFYYGGNRPTIKATWADGRSIEGTPNHRVKVANANGYDWKRLDALEAGDFVSVKLGANLWANQDADLLKGFAPPALYGCQKTIKLPTKMTPDLARFLGMYIAEGNMTSSNTMVRVTNLNADVLAACERIVSETFGITGRVETDARNGVTNWVCASKSLCEFLTHIGAGGDSSSKQIPWSVLQSSEDCVREFVGALWLDGYVTEKGMAAICLNSPELLRQLQVVLNNFGLRAQLIRKYNKPYDKFFHELGVHGADSRRFGELFRLDDAHKTEALQKLCGIAKKVDAADSDVIPAFRSEIQAFVRARKDTQRFRSIFDPRTRHLSRHTVAAVATFYGAEFFAEIPDLREILENNIHFVALRAIEEGFAPVYDFQVPTNHAFLGNGMVNHNTVNMPQDCTADEIYDAYLQSWKMGVKAVAIYRDGSKRTQPLSTASDAQKAEKAEKKESEVRRAARRKLPDERNSITHKFSIAGQEGYFMVGLYEDGSPGEIFIKMSKEGSTISGLMDSFAVAVSMCLQYGVPLRVLVNKFSHTRFEPSGYTTNRDIPIAKSLMDYIFRWFDLKFHPNGDNGHVGKVIEAGATHAALPEASLFGNESANGGGNGGNHGNVGNAQREVSQMQQDAPPCPDCGALTVRSGACYKCNECGATTGCG